MFSTLITADPSFCLTKSFPFFIQTNLYTFFLAVFLAFQKKALRYFVRFSFTKLPSFLSDNLFGIRRTLIRLSVNIIKMEGVVLTLEGSLWTACKRRDPSLSIRTRFFAGDGSSRESSQWRGVKDIQVLQPSPPCEKSICLHLHLQREIFLFLCYDIT